MEGLTFGGMLVGHIGITVDDVNKACKRFESLGVEFVKKPDDGNIILLIRETFKRRYIIYDILT